MAQEIHELKQSLYHLKLEYMLLADNLSPKIRIDDAIKDIKQLRGTLKEVSDILKRLEQ
jgi:hypothetical protein